MAKKCKFSLSFPLVKDWRRKEALDKYAMLSPLSLTPPVLLPRTKRKERSFVTTISVILKNAFALLAGLVRP